MRALAVVLTLTVACGPACESPPEPSPEPAGSLPLVGEWRWIRSCDAVVQAFRDAGLVGLTRVWLVETRYFAREDLIDRDRPCAGAEETRYVYFFEASGRWGVLDDDDVLVDDRDFNVVDRNTIVFGAVEVDHLIDPGGVLTFDVEVPGRCDAMCRDGYAWAVATFAAATLRRAA
jgi:hypothetical protein